MWKIYHFLKTVRVSLVIVLLLIIIISQLARAETAIIYKLSAPEAFVTCKDHASITWSSPGAVVADCYTGDVRTVEEGNTIAVKKRRGETNVWDPVGRINWSSHSCEAKELTNGGRPITDRPDLYYEEYKDHPVLSKLFSQKAPEGIDAADWFPDYYRSCENNCVIQNRRHTSDKIGRSTKEEDGTSRSVFFKTQTGEVCVPEKKKPNEPPSPPPPDTDNGADNGNGQGNTGSDNGNGQGGSDGNSGGSDSGNGGSEGGDGGDGDNGSGSSGSGGGSSGGGGTTGVPGGGTSGGQNGEGSGDGGEGGAGGEGSDNGDGQSGSGDSGGQGSDQGGGDGAVDGDGKGDGEGSISGGSCAADQAPSCKGDPVQCFIAVEQWKTACAALGNASSVSGGNCKTNTPPECKGDAAQCYIVKQQFEQNCAAAAAQDRAEGLEEYGRGQQGYLNELAKEGDPDSIQSALDVEKIEVASQLNTKLVSLGDTCPGFPEIDLGIFGKHEIPSDDICRALREYGRILLAMSYVFAFGIIVRAF